MSVRVIEETEHYRIVENTKTGDRALVHLACGYSSWRKDDVERRYCRRCHLHFQREAPPPVTTP